LSYNFYEKHQNLLKNTYINNANFKINTDIDFISGGFNKKVLYDNTFNNFFVRSNNKKTV
jgi:hypothetical protein